MCTVSIIATPGGFRVAHNRDELRSRAHGEPPAWRAFPGGARALCPIDTDSGGTWVAANESGLCLCILNRNPEPPPVRDPAWVSRGGIIGPLLGCATADEAIDLHQRTWTQLCAPYRLIAISCDADQQSRVIELLGEPGREPIVTEHKTPTCFVSSGLGDSVVQPRLPLFDELIEPAPTPKNQDTYHHHHWPDRTHQSVLMTRPDARTVSITTVVVRSGEAPTMGYEPIEERVTAT